MNVINALVNEYGVDPNSKVGYVLVYRILFIIHGENFSLFYAFTFIPEKSLAVIDASFHQLS